MAIGLSLLNTAVLAQDNLLITGKATAIDPRSSQKVDVQIFYRTSVQNEFNVIRFFFTYTCEYGQKYDAEMGTSWAKHYHQNLSMFACLLLLKNLIQQ